MEAHFGGGGGGAHQVERVGHFGMVLAVALEPYLQPPPEQRLRLGHLAAPGQRAGQVGQGRRQRGALWPELQLPDRDCAAVQGLDQRTHRQLAAGAGRWPRLAVPAVPPRPSRVEHARLAQDVGEVVVH